MSAAELVEELDDDTTPAPAPVTPAPDAPRKGSFLAELHAERDAALEGGDTKVLLVGSSTRLAARYRALSREEQEMVQARHRKLEHESRRAKSVSSADANVQLAAFSLSLACVELLAVEDGRVRPLVEVLAEDAADTEGDEPLRFDRRAARVLGWEHEPQATSASICESMHDQDGSATSLMRAARRYGEWVSGAESAALEDSLEGI
jgi:hypothetical protein